MMQQRHGPVTMRVEGLEVARAALERTLRQHSDGARDGLELVGQQGVTETQRRAPVLTGRLRRSYTYVVGSDTSGAYVEIGSNVVYAPAQEFGARGRSGTPHLRPGIDAVRPKVGALIAEGARRRSGGML